MAIKKLINDAVQGLREQNQKLTQKVTALETKIADLNKRLDALPREKRGWGPIPLPSAVKAEFRAEHAQLLAQRDKLSNELGQLIGQRNIDPATGGRSPFPRE